MPTRVFSRLSSVLSRISPRGLAWGAHLAIFAFSGIVAFLVRFEFVLHPYALKQLAYGIPLWVAAKSLAFRCLALDRACWRHTSVSEAYRNYLGNLLGSGLGALLILLLAPAGFPRSIFLLDLLVCTQATLALPLLVRLIADRAANQPPDTPRVLIYGAGSAGVMLLRALRSNPKVQYLVCGFVDDHLPKVGMKVQSVPVLCHGDSLPAIIAGFAIAEILIAIPSASEPQMARILERCDQAGVRCRTVPGLDEIVSRPALPVQVGEAALEDPPGRSMLPPHSSEVGSMLDGKTVLIAGAAGSIGSELCHQIARTNPGSIVALDAGETPLYHIEAEMRRRFPHVPFHAEIGDIQNRHRLNEVFAKYGPALVYHAAAYKHEPLMEKNIVQAVENNVLATFTLATIAAQYGAQRFVMISSDQAAHPTNVMGATKRVAELLIRSLQEHGTQFVSVRFANVPDSQGSAIPLFRKQLAADGPATVTHPDMCRYFITIPEAAQLVLEASAMGKGGEIFVLDMRRETSGKPDTIEEQTLPTRHEKIKVLAGNGTPGKMVARVNTLRALCAARDARGLVLELKDIVPEYLSGNQPLPQTSESPRRHRVAGA